MARKNILFCILVCVVNSIILIAGNYVVGDSVLFPYELSKSFRTFVPGAAVGDFDWDFLLERNVVLIAETTDSSLIGLYDPDMFYYLNSTKTLDPTYLRYFSREDYINKTNTGVALLNIYNMIQSGKVSPYIIQKAMKRAEDTYNIEAIGALDIVSIGYYPEQDMYPSDGFAVFFNIFKLKPDTVQRIFLDSPETGNTDEINEVARALKEVGFVEVSERVAKPVTAALVSSLFNYRRYERFILYCAAASLALMIYTAFIYLSKYKKHIYVSRVCGADFFKMYRIIFKYCIGAGVLIAIISSTLTGMYLGLIRESILRLSDYIVLDFIFLCLLISCITAIYCFHFFRASREMR